MKSLRYTTIEETSMFQTDCSHEEFVSHFYKTRYDRLEGLLMPTPELLRAAAKKTTYDFDGKCRYELCVMEDKGQNGMMWSMNWYKLRDSDNKVYTLSEEEEEGIVADFFELRKTTPLTAEIYIFQGDGSDMLLIAVSFILKYSFNPNNPINQQGGNVKIPIDMLHL